MKDTIDMAREAGGYPAAATDRALLLFSESHLERFAALVRADEREACAKVCGELVPNMSRTANDASVWDVATFDCADAIRARAKP
jgi:hypothetical protein